MKIITLIFALASLLMLAGCATADATNGQWHVHVFTVFKDLKLGDLKIPTTQGVIEVNGYGSTSAVTGADIATIAGVAMKAALAIP